MDDIIRHRVVAKIVQLGFLLHNAGWYHVYLEHRGIISEYLIRQATEEIYMEIFDAGIHQA